MLHVILTILKIIGILLLVILSILLAVILLVLFVPVRYRLHGRYEKGALEADGRISWLLRLVRINLSWKDNKGLAEIRVLWFKLKSFQIPKEEPPGDTADFAKDHKYTSSDPQEDSAPSSGNDWKESSNPQENPEPAPDGIIRKIAHIGGKLWELVRNALVSIPGIPAELIDLIDRKMEWLGAKIDAVFRKIEPYLDATTERALRKVIRYLKWALRGYAPRRIEGYIHFGTGQPDITGRLAGLIFVLLPESGKGYDVDPDFYKAVLETDTTVTGHMQMYRLVWVGIRILADRECRTVLFRILGWDKKKKRKKQQ